MGIDRLTMMLTDSNNIKVNSFCLFFIEQKKRINIFFSFLQEVLLFPACKPIKEGEDAATTDGTTSISLS